MNPQTSSSIQDEKETSDQEGAANCANDAAPGIQPDDEEEEDDDLASAGTDCNKTMAEAVNERAELMVM